MTQPLQNYTYTIEPLDYSPRLYYLLTNKRMPFKNQMAYYARKWSRRPKNNSQKHTS